MQRKRKRKRRRKKKERKVDGPCEFTIHLSRVESIPGTLNSYKKKKSKEKKGRGERVGEDEGERKM